jgi:hypothetical protein
MDSLSVFAPVLAEEIIVPLLACLCFTRTRLADCFTSAARLADSLPGDDAAFDVCVGVGEAGRECVFEEARYRDCECDCGFDDEGEGVGDVARG